MCSRQFSQTAQIAAKRATQSGTAMILVLSLITLITIELTTMSLVLTKGIGDEAVLMNQNVSARQITETATTRMTEQINNALNYYKVQSDDLANGSESLKSAINSLYKGNGYDLSSQTVAITNPESGASANIKNVSFDAWVSNARPPYYLVNVIANVGSVQLSSKRWVLVQPCRQGGSIREVSYDYDYSHNNDFVNDTDPYNITEADFTTMNYQNTYSTYDPVNGWVVTGGSEFLKVWSAAKGVSIPYYGNAAEHPGGYGGLIIDGSRQRVFFANKNNIVFSYKSGFMLWNPSAGLSTLIPDGTLDGGGPSAPQSLALDNNSGRVYVGSSVKADGFYVWDDASGLQTLIAPHGSTDAEGFRSTVVDPTGRVYFGQNRAKGNWYTWHPTTGLSTLLTTEPYPGVASTTVDPISGIVYMAARPANVFGVGSFPKGALLGYKNGRKILQVDFPKDWSFGVGNNAIAVDPKRQRVFLGNSYDGDQNSNFAIWNPATGLSLLTSDAGDMMNPQSILVDDTTGRVYFGDGAIGGWKTPSYYTWAPGDTQATEIVQADDKGCLFGYNNSAALDTKNQVIAFAGPESCGVNVYSPNSGLIITKNYTGNSPYWGDNGNITLDPATGDFYVASRRDPQGVGAGTRSVIRLTRSTSYDPPVDSDADAQFEPGYRNGGLYGGAQTLLWDRLSSSIYIPTNSNIQPIFGNNIVPTYTWAVASSSCDRNY
ncbi:MAG: SMP-30/gluconolactonase/LRE family protein [Cyanobacteria bacterium]|nr:SMP-30/gluconolactonase/LRE family protein [Cyanobacteriota bacterium]